MPHCTFMELCPLFNGDPAVVSAHLVEEYKRKYCHADKFACARYLIATSVGQEKVPFDLSPHESAKALKIMRAAG